jgi:HEAT repeat protein
VWRDEEAGDVWEQAKALESAGRLRGETIDDLLATARRGQLPQAQAAVHVLGFGRVPSKRLAEVVSALIHLDDADLPVDVRAQAAEALGDQLQMTKRSALQRVAVTHLIRQLGNRAPELRFWSACSLGKLGATRVRTPLRQLLTDESITAGFWTVAQEASDALDRIDGRWTDHGRRGCGEHDLCLQQWSVVTNN